MTARGAFSVTIAAGSSVDGSAGAPAGTPQFPTLLNGRTARPPWKVAGVDYAVGVHPGVVLKVPSAGNMPSGATVGNRVINVTGSNVVLSGYDLTGYTVMLQDSATGTVKITDCAATTGVNIRSTVGAKARLVVTYCNFNGGGVNADRDFQLIKVWTPLTVQYCLIQGAPEATYSGSNTIIQYNAFAKFGWNTGVHTNVTYVVGGSNVTIQYNTMWSGNTRSGAFPIGIGAAIALFDDGGSYTNTNLSNNVLISDLSGGASYLIGYYISPPFTATGGVVSNNYGYWANGGGFGMFYGGSPGTIQATYSGNIDMSTGKTVGAP